MAVLVFVGVMGLVIGVTAYAYRDCDDQLPDDWTSFWNQP